MNGVAYKTTELELASFLKARGHRLLFARLDGRVVALEPSGDAALDVESYFNGDEVSARELFEAHRGSRALIQPDSAGVAFGCSAASMTLCLWPVDVFISPESISSPAPRRRSGSKVGVMDTALLNQF